MNSKERVLTTLNHEEPDRVPIFTLGIDSRDVIRGYKKQMADKRPKKGKKRKKIAELSILDVKKVVKLYQHIGIDLIAMPVCLFPFGESAGFGVTKPGLKTPPETNMVDEYGRVFHFYKAPDSDLSLLNYVGGIFDSETGNLEEIIDKYEKWAPLDVNIKERYSMYKSSLRYSKDKGPYIIPSLAGFLEVTWESFGFENYAKLLYEHPDFIEQVTKNNEDFSRALTEILIEKYNIELLLVYDDLGYKTGPFISPRQFNKLIFPKMKSLVKLCHKSGVKVILHSCGNLNQILDKIIETGIDGLNPIEPSASMDIFKIKKDYGKKLSLIGNVDTTDLLSRGSPEQVRMGRDPEPGATGSQKRSHSPAATYSKYQTGQGVPDSPMK